ncbi:hypothetical protein NDU88_003859 [Pleurodeles waltl]|uniref:Uncharacterized protein n=1 Tax=Pleurodeles waltl TaxID=8319 RepID=A0AAV7V176_PLEWA|nr:hypothetical protein NDU88_003859 [Pleurodeles waltl]
MALFQEFRSYLCTHQYEHDGKSGLRDPVPRPLGNWAHEASFGEEHRDQRSPGGRLQRHHIKSSVNLGVTSGPWVMVFVESSELLATELASNGYR